MADSGYRVDLCEEELPRYFYNILPDLPEPLPMPLNPANGEPIKPEMLEPLFCKELIRQEFAEERFVKIPRELRELFLKIGRPRPLCRATRLERALKLPEDVRIFYKREDLSPVGSHKPNTALAQAYYATKAGVETLTTETGAGQWGSALAMACAFTGMKCKVYMVRVSYEQKPYRRMLMRMFGADVVASPSDTTEIGKKIRERFPDTPGSLGIAISEAVEVAAKDAKTNYSLGSVLNHVLMHQTMIGLETQKQLHKIDEKPDVIIGCVGGGSNFAGLAYPFIAKKLAGKSDCEFIAVEPDVVPSMTRGDYKYDFGDTGKLTPLLKMCTLGCEFIPPAIHAGGLRYHGCAPTLSLLVNKKIVRAMAYDQKETFEAGRLFARSEGIIPAPESNFAVKAAIDQALAAKQTKEGKTILFNLSGHGLLDLPGYHEMLGL
ncbi:MAG: TrpB-like pyridoxal phosphate-dependent enzyme [Candidatus Aenigmarchaeota archaeon]|nr:TrpB-like pyridoxal phosphate-dependent enzyme [Candidatus Aenigmarchaeota archaeon]